MSDKMAAAAAGPQPQPGPSLGPGPGPPAAEADRGSPRGGAAGGEAEAEVFECPAYCSDPAWRQNEQRRHGLYCEITLAFGGAGMAREYRAHRSVLAAATEYFTPLLSEGFAESRSGRVELQKWSSECDTVEAFIGFMHTGTICVSPGNVHEVLEMADRLEAQKCTRSAGVLKKAESPRQWCAGALVSVPPCSPQRCSLAIQELVPSRPLKLL